MVDARCMREHDRLAERANQLESVGRRRSPVLARRTGVPSQENPWTRVYELFRLESNMTAKREQNRDQQRERILDAARSLFAIRGFDSVTMAELAEVAGVARATVFNHFGSKVALVEAITENVF